MSRTVMYAKVECCNGARGYFKPSLTDARSHVRASPCGSASYIFEPEGPVPESNVIGVPTWPSTDCRAWPPTYAPVPQCPPHVRRPRLTIFLSNHASAPPSRGLRAHLVWVLLALLIPWSGVTTVSSQAAGQSNPGELTTASPPPQHAVVRTTGSGWSCKPGYRKSGETCTGINLPANAYLTGSSYGSGWECRRGYLAKDEACVAVNVPEHAFLTGSSSSGGWQCERGYRKDGQQCVAVVLPPNAFLTEDTSYGRGWDCERGYRQTPSGCDAILVPANAYRVESGYGQGWNCERGFRQAGTACAAVVVPANGYLDAAGSGFKCDRRYFRSGNACVVVALPERGFLQASGGGWDCEPPFRKRDEKCVAP